MTPRPLMTADEVASLFKKEKRWAYRQSQGGKLLATAARRFPQGSRCLLRFDRATVERIKGAACENYSDAV